MAPGQERKCTCGCEKQVTAQTERNHIKGRIMPVSVKAFNASRRLSVLELSPDRRRAQAAKSALLSPKKVRPAKKRAGTSTSAGMDVAADAHAPEYDILPQFHAQDHGPSLNEGAGPSFDDPSEDMGPAPPDIDVNMQDPNQELEGAHGLYDPEAAADLHQATTVTIEEEEEDLDAAMYMDADLDPEAEEAGPEGEDDFWGNEDQDYDEYEWLYGLPMGDIIDKEMERELAQFAEELSEDDLAILRAFAFKTEEHLTNTAFAKLPYTFPDANIHTWPMTAAQTLAAATLANTRRNNTFTTVFFFRSLDGLCNVLSEPLPGLLTIKKFRCRFGALKRQCRVYQRKFSRVA
ncbi:hypothetical protein B0H14DRAFT_3436047 [Mycena olivaceomarginata]|nr:hypothetical protein B0H14DRAFT_3436047 [Mycena olivaceomarginata]